MVAFCEEASTQRWACQVQRRAGADETDKGGQAADLVRSRSTRLQRQLREEDSLITNGEIKDAIEEARKRVGPELAELLTAEAMTEEEMEKLDTRKEITRLLLVLELLRRAKQEGDTM